MEKINNNKGKQTYSYIFDILLALTCAMNKQLYTLYTCIYYSNMYILLNNNKIQLTSNKKILSRLYIYMYRNGGTLKQIFKNFNCELLYCEKTYDVQCHWPLTLGGSIYRL